MPLENPSCGAGAAVDVVDPLAVPDWDQQVSAMPGAGFFHGAAWARVLQATYGYRPQYLVRRESGRLQALLPCMEVASWLTGRRGVSLPFSDSVEPLAPDAASFHVLWRAAQELGLRQRWKYLECRGGKPWLPEAPASTTYFRHSVALHPDDAVLFSALDDATRRAVRKAERQNLAVEFSQGMEAVREFYGLLCRTRRRHGLPPQPFAFFANIQRYVLENKIGWIVLARQGSVPVAGAVFVHLGHSALYKYGASDERYLPLRANNLVMWKAIQWYSRQGVTRLDLGRTSTDNAGLRRFKLAWGAREEQLEYIRLDIGRNTYTLNRDESSGWYTRIFNVLPMPLSRALGRVLYGHMG